MKNSLQEERAQATKLGWKGSRAWSMVVLALNANTFAAATNRSHQGSLTEVEGSVQLTSWWVHFHIEIIIYLCYKTNCLNEEVNCAEPSPSVSVPWTNNHNMTGSIVYLNEMSIGLLNCFSCWTFLNAIAPRNCAELQKNGSYISNKVEI